MDEGAAEARGRADELVAPQPPVEAPRGAGVDRLDAGQPRADRAVEGGVGERRRSEDRAVGSTLRVAGVAEQRVVVAQAERVVPDAVPARLVVPLLHPDGRAIERLDRGIPLFVDVTSEIEYR